MTGYAYPNGDGSYALFYDITSIPEWMRSEIESIIIPSGSGILKKNADGVFYYEKIVPQEPDPEPEKPKLTVEQRLEQIESTVAYTYLQVDYLMFLAEITQQK